MRVYGDTGQRKYQTFNYQQRISQNFPIYVRLFVNFHTSPNQWQGLANGLKNGLKFNEGPKRRGKVTNPQANPISAPFQMDNFFPVQSPGLLFKLLK